VLVREPQPFQADKQDGTGDRSTNSPPIITLPKGGGAIRGIGEKFAANPVTGTGSMTVPIYTSSGRSGFGPQLSLSYDSGHGNSSFGFGWSETGKGLAIVEACRKLGITEQTYYRWKKEYGGLRVDQAKRLKALEQENLRLKRIVADQAVDLSILKEVASGNF